MFNCTMASWIREYRPNATRRELKKFRQMFWRLQRAASKQALAQWLAALQGDS